MNITVDAGVVAEDCGGTGTERKASLPFDEAVAAAIAAAIPSTASERIDLLMAGGRVLADNMVAPAMLPRFDHSAMDGYAARTDDFCGIGPWSFEVSGMTAAGDAPHEPVDVLGTAVEIYTGAPIPEGFDAVVIRERCTLIGGDRILTSFLPRTGENIRRRGCHPR